MLDELVLERCGGLGPEYGGMICFFVGILRAMFGVEKLREIFVSG